MEKFEDISKPKTSEKKDRLDSFFNRHLAMLTLSVTVLFTPEVKAVENTATDNTPKIETFSITPQKLESERRKALTDFQETLKNEQVLEKIIKIKDFFGPAVKNFLNDRDIESDINNIRKFEPKKDNRGFFVGEDDANIITLGSILADAYHDRWEQHEQKKNKVAFNNIESVPDLKTEELANFLNNFYPNNYLSNSISSVTFTGKTNIEAGGKSQVVGSAETYGMSSMAKASPDDTRLPITINMPAEGITKDYFIEVLKHEIGHPNDWSSSPVLTSAERVSMLYEVSERCFAKNKLASKYVDNINLDKVGSHFGGEIKDEETKKKYLNYIKVTEYWPEIAKAYFDNPNGLKEDSPEDFAVVEKWAKILSR